jgi:hypothetical protein
MNNCPICGALPEVRDTGVCFAAHCSVCYEPDEDAPSWRVVQGAGRTEDEAIEQWLERARELACDRPPPIRMPYEPAALFAELEEQVWAEAERQAEWTTFVDPVTKIEVRMSKC